MEHDPEAVEREYPSLEDFTVALRSESFPLDTQVRLTIQRGERAPLPLLLVRRPEAERVTILFNGAVDLERTGGQPIFQRSSWWRSIPTHQIYVCDPGTAGEDALSLNWGQESLAHDALPDIGSAVRALCSALGVHDSRRRTYFGSSAGGFLALMAAAQDEDPHVIVNNAQFDWTRWMRGGVVALSARRFNAAAPAALRRAIPWRTSALRRLSQRSTPLSVDYWVNIASPHDLKVDLTQAMSFVHDERALAERFAIHRYSDPVSLHNPLGREQTLELLSSHPAAPQTVTMEAFAETPAPGLQPGDPQIRYTPAASEAGYAYPLTGGADCRPIARIRPGLSQRDALIIAELIGVNGDRRPAPGWHWSQRKRRSFQYLSGGHPVHEDWVELPEIPTDDSDIGIVLSISPWPARGEDPRRLVEALGLKSETQTRTDSLNETSFRELQ
ncbi:prolyl oligopeptidase family serine peptidase [Kocuria palustris]|uniref:prolyl oligopeptidase family serine peptidase n=1 Tax=Kocuria palustris TaxID=71999 RepID=UPI0034508DF1